MNNIYIDAESDSPKIALDYTNGHIELEGKSFPGDAFSFYEPILQWLNSYFDGNAQVKTVIDFKLIYYNSASSQILLNILDIINAGSYNELEINWYYQHDCEDSFEEYEDMAEEYPKLKIHAIAY